MNNEYLAVIRINSEKLNEIFDRLKTAEETIRGCYDELRELGIVEIEDKKNAASGN